MRRRVPPELIVLILLAILSRGWGLYSPGGRAWDEVYFEDYAANYFTGVYYVDVHPPLGKLLFALTAWIARVPADALANGVSFPVLRLFPAIAGVLLVPTVWWLLRGLGASRATAALGATMVLLDLGLLVQSRLALMDVPLALAAIGAVAAWVAARRADGRARAWLLLLAAVLGGAAVSIKWTGLASLGLVIGAWMIDVRRTRPLAGRVVHEAMLLLVVPAAVYLGSFAVHFSLLPHDGPASALMSPGFQSTLEGNTARSRRVEAPSFVAKTMELHRVMMSANLGMVKVAQPASSPWYTWPLATHRMQLWAGDDAAGARRIELMWNPAVSIGIVLILGWFVGLAIRGRAPSLGGAGALLGAGYLMNFVPYGLIPRPLYLYHYTTAMVFAIAMAALALGAMAGWRDEVPWTPRSRRLFVGVLAAVLVAFVVFAPLAYGTPQSARGLAVRHGILER